MFFCSPCTDYTTIHTAYGTMEGNKNSSSTHLMKRSVIGCQDTHDDTIRKHKTHVENQFLMTWPDRPAEQEKKKKKTKTKTIRRTTHKYVFEIRRTNVFELNGFVRLGNNTIAANCVVCKFLRWTSKHRANHL